MGNSWMEVYSVCYGYVTASGFADYCGNMVQVRYGQEYFVTYMHLQGTGLVAQYYNVTESTSRIGYTGNTYTQNSTIGTHLHISVSRDDSVSPNYAQYFIDPLAFIKSWDLTQN